MLDLKPLDLRLLYEIQKKASLAQKQLCRVLNARWKYYCSRRSCFANGRKKKHFTIFPCVCKIPIWKVVASLKRLEKKGLIATRIERKGDGKNNRGYDFMRANYSTLAVAFGGL